MLAGQKIKSQKSMNGKAIANSPLKVSKQKTEPLKKNKIKGDTSFIIEEMMDQGIAKGDITMSDGTGTDNMTCIIAQFRDPEEVKAEMAAQTNSADGLKEEKKQ